MKKTLTILLIAVVILGGAYFYVTSYVDASLKAVDPNDNNQILIEIPSGSSTGAIADILLQKNLIKDVRVFKYYTQKTESDSKLKAGSYVLSKNMNMDELLASLIKGGSSSNTENVTIIEGLTYQETAKSIADQMGLNYEKLISIIENGSKFKEEFEFMKDNEGINNLQGYMLPETYNVYINCSEEDIIKILLKGFDDFYVKVMKDMLPKSKLKFEEVVNLASIVEKEAVLDEERDEVAAAFLNRLGIDMKLQSCATVNYAHGEWKERLTNDDTAIDSPFNTYIIKGLPPTAINSPGKTSIKAVLSPADVDYLYFVAKGDGSHYFSNNYEDHLDAKNKYLD